LYGFYKICRLLGAVECVANSVVATNVENLCDQILCIKWEINEFHKLQCIQGDYSTCGVMTLPVCPCEVDVSVGVTVLWWRFEKIWVGRFNDGKDRHALCFEHKQTLPHVIITFLRPRLVELVVHNFEAKW
jgi:hypothetical protein